MKAQHNKQWLEETLRSLDGIQKASPAPYLLTRINARLQERNTEQNFWSFLAGFISKPAVAMAGVILLIGLNVMIISLSNYSKKPTVSTQVNTDNRDEFALDISSIYEIENIEPNASATKK